MEFPHLGKNCSEPTCNRLDFLPVQCDSCEKVFCSSHFNYERHECPGAHRKNVQVPVCPLCGEPVPTAPGVEPDLTVGQHIDKQCKSDSKKIFTNRCSHKGCKRKELIPVNCSQCKRNFCLRHRHNADHDCTGTAPPSMDTRALMANAAEYRRTNKPTTLFNANPKPRAASTTQRNTAAPATASSSSSHMQTVQGNMSEDEALARAIALSIMELDETADRNRRNEAAAAAAAATTTTTGSSSRRNPLTVGGRDGQQTNGKDKCSLS